MSTFLETQRGCLPAKHRPVDLSNPLGMHSLPRIHALSHLQIHKIQQPTKKKNNFRELMHFLESRKLLLYYVQVFTTYKNQTKPLLK